jgi:predicted anti-sigma-YlaC factor YlaD
MLSCKQTSLLVSQSLDRRLRWRERMAVRMHLWICVYCRRFTQQLALIRRMMQPWQDQATAQSEVALSQAARERIAQQLDKFY